jgi:hypothetical protein
LAVAKAVRENPKITNVQLGALFQVSRNTIHDDRLAAKEQLVNATLTENELMRSEELAKLATLEEECQRHRHDGKLSLGAIDQILSIIKERVNLTGCRKPVVEKKLVKHSPIQFQTFIGSPAQFAKAKAEVIEAQFSEPDKQLKAGEPDGN